jgi:hypothetical protein
MGIAIRAIYRESRGKCVRVMTVPSINVAAYDLDGFHSRNLTRALGVWRARIDSLFCGVEVSVLDAATNRWFQKELVRCFDPTLAHRKRKVIEIN